MNPAPRSNSTDWASLFSEFHTRHKSADGKKMKYTAVFNAAMEAYIKCSETPMEWRILAWIWRRAWGNNSDYCVAAIGGEAVGQRECSKTFGVKKQRICDCIAYLRKLNFVLPKTGHRLYPVDDPPRCRAESGSRENSESPHPNVLFREFCEQWGSAYPADFQELQSAEATVTRLKKVRLGLFHEWKKNKKGRTSAIPTPVKIQPSIQQEGASVVSSFTVSAANERTNAPTSRPETSTAVAIAAEPVMAMAPEIEEIRQIVEELAGPVMGEMATNAQVIEIHRRLNAHGPRPPAQYRARLESAIARGKLQSIGLLSSLADNCADYPNWKPPKQTKTARKEGMAESVMDEMQRRINEWGHL